MHLNAQPPIFVPDDKCREIEALSKAALMDIVWNLAAMCSDSCDDPDAVMAVFRKEAEVVLAQRKQAAPAAKPRNGHAPRGTSPALDRALKTLLHR